MSLAPFTVWAPQRERVQLELGGVGGRGNGGEPVRVPMSQDEGGWWHPDGPVPDLHRVPEVDYGFVLDDAEPAAPGSPVALAAARRARAVPHLRPGPVRLERPRLDGTATGRRGDLRAARRHLHRRGHAGRRHRPARPPRRTGRRLRRAAAGERVQRSAQLGLRRGAVVRGARRVRRAGGLPALRRRLPRTRAGRDPGRRLQPSRVRAGTTCPSSARTCTAPRPTPGATPRTSTASTRTRSVATSSTTP